MHSKAIICALAAASLGMSSLSWAQGHGQPDPHRQMPRGAQHGPMERDGHDGRDGRGPGPRGFDQRDNRHGPGPNGFGPRGEARSGGDYGARGPQFHRGGRLPSPYRSHQYVVNNWREHRLSPPPRGHQWVQVGADYVLVAMATGVIVQLVLSP